MKVHDKTHATIKRVELPDRQLMGWVVSISHEGEMKYPFFTDKSYGGRKQAYRAAQQFAAGWGERSEVKGLLLRLKPRKNSRSGIPGVARYEGDHNRGPFWLACWHENGRMVQKRFAVSAYSEDKARELAIATREAGVKAYAERLEEVRKRDTDLLQRTGWKPEEAPQDTSEDAQPAHEKRRCKFS